MATKVPKIIDPVDRATAESTLREVMAGAELAEHSLAQDGIAPASDTPAAKSGQDVPGEVASEEVVADAGPEVTTARKRRSREEQVEFLMNRAKKQRERGIKGLTRDVETGVATLSRTVLINDMNIGSSIERFLSVIDTAAYLVNRRGEMVLGAPQAQKVMDNLFEMADGMLTESGKALSAANDFLRTAKEKDAFGDDADVTDDENWLKPEYKHPAFNLSINLKHPLSVRVVNAMIAYDRAIHIMTELQWNMQAQQRQVDTLRSEERRASMALHVFAARSLSGMRRRIAPIMDAAAPSADGNVSTGAAPQSTAETASTRVEQMAELEVAA